MPPPLEGCSIGLLLSEWIPCGSFRQRQRSRVGDCGGGDHHQDVDCDWIARFFLDMLMIWARPTKSSWRLFAQSSLGGDDEDISNICDDDDDGKENDGYFASPSVLLYDYNDEENVNVGDDGIDDAGDDEEEDGDTEISNPGLAQRSRAMVMVAGTRLGRGQFPFHQLVILSFKEE